MSVVTLVIWWIAFVSRIDHQKLASTDFVTGPKYMETARVCEPNVTGHALQGRQCSMDYLSEKRHHCNLLTALIRQM